MKYRSIIVNVDMPGILSIGGSTRVELPVATADRLVRVWLDFANQLCHYYHIIFVLSCLSRLLSAEMKR